MLHFAAASRHSRNALLQTLQELDANIAQRDELYRTARDIAVFSQLYDNVKAIDAYVFYLAANGNSLYHHVHVMYLDITKKFHFPIQKQFFYD